MGQSVAARFTNEGASVMVGGRTVDELTRFARTIDGRSLPCNITRQDDLDALVAGTVDRFGRLDIAVNAMGLNQVKPFLDVRWRNCGA